MEIVHKLQHNDSIGTGIGTCTNVGTTTCSGT